MQNTNNLNRQKSNRPIEYKLSEDSKKVIRDILSSKTENGVVLLDELGECLEAFGFNVDAEDIEFLKKHLDDNGDGHLEIEELINNIDVINYHCFYGKELMKEFLRIDVDQDGIIRFPEMLRFLTTHQPKPLAPDEARRLLDELVRKYDVNFDGKFSYAEFVKIYMSDKLPFKSELEHGIAPLGAESKADATMEAPPSSSSVKGSLATSTASKKGKTDGARRKTTKAGTSSTPIKKSSTSSAANSTFVVTGKKSTVDTPSRNTSVVTAPPSKPAEGGDRDEGGTKQQVPVWERLQTNKTSASASAAAGATKSIGKKAGDSRTPKTSVTKNGK